MRLELAAAARTRQQVDARQRKHKALRSRGVVVARVEVDEHAIATALIASGRLSADEALRRDRVEAELGGLLAEWAARWLPCDA